jgi:hypothetical protein
LYVDFNMVLCVKSFKCKLDPVQDETSLVEVYEAWGILNSYRAIRLPDDLTKAEKTLDAYKACWADLNASLSKGIKDLSGNISKRVADDVKEREKKAPAERRMEDARLALEEAAAQRSQRAAAGDTARARKPVVAKPTKEESAYAIEGPSESLPGPNRPVIEDAKATYVTLSAPGAPIIPY